MSQPIGSSSANKARIGVDLGGTKIEFVALEGDGRELHRHRVATPRNDYDGTVRAIKEGVEVIERDLGRPATVGIGIPGTISGMTHAVKNANSTWINGRPFDRDLGSALQREVRCANDANCLAVSEATDGAAAGKHIVFAVILGTGCGGGVAFNGHVHNGCNGVAGEWGHNTLPWMRPEEYPGPRRAIAGATVAVKRGFQHRLEADYQRATNRLKGEIVARVGSGERPAMACLERYEDRLTRSLANLINILDPDVIVIGGGVSQVPRLYRKRATPVEGIRVWPRSGYARSLPRSHGDAAACAGPRGCGPGRKVARHAVHAVHISQ
jgi:fructokinase